MSTCLVAGITGRVGRAAARHLLAHGQRVRGYVRDPAAARGTLDPRVEVAAGDLGDARALAAAMRDTAGAYVMVPPVVDPSPGYAEARALADTWRAALVEAAVPRAVVLSSLGSERTTGLGLITSTHILEQTLGTLAPACAVAFVRAGGFLDNYAHAPAAARATGVFDTFLAPTDRGFPMVASDDIGAEVARLLAAPAWGGAGPHVVELASFVSADELARAIGAAIGRDVTARSIPREAWAAVIERFGVPRGRTAAYEEMTEAILAGKIWFRDDLDPPAERVAATTTPSEFFASRDAPR
jgi:uncharacterized protein YbjT (DUF2867 family)|nr:NAD(P)H-binding protein [Kofleriaceae bacterium]